MPRRGDHRLPAQRDFIFGVRAHHERAFARAHVRPGRSNAEPHDGTLGHLLEKRLDAAQLNYVCLIDCLSYPYKTTTASDERLHGDAHGQPHSWVFGCTNHLSVSSPLGASDAAPHERAFFCVSIDCPHAHAKRHAVVTTEQRAN